ncbi:ribosomal RNA small subunit methyltransferase A [Patescibacteria group bacterium]|nr:ribosomal RNA small subunit methyltransferase A [Patescibacteria group bacterium]
MTPTEIKTILQTIGGGANKTLGQHFLVDPSALEAILTAADITKDERITEIGPGLGVLTGQLLEKGATLTAIEQDRRFLSYLEVLAKRFPQGSLSLQHGDAARLFWEHQDGSWKLVANLPYSITSLVLRKALWSKNPPTKVVVLVQREVAERVLARDGKTSLLSLMVALASSSARIVKRIPPGAFFPPPKVDSAILEINSVPFSERLERFKVDPDLVMAVAKRGFAHPRKFLFSNLGLTPHAKTLADQIGTTDRVRSEALNLDQWCALARILRDTGLLPEEKESHEKANRKNVNKKE